MAMSDAAVSRQTRIRRSRFSLGRFFILSHFFRNQALEGEFHERPCAVRLGRRKAEQRNAVGLIQGPLEEGFTADARFELVDLAAALGAVINSLYRNSDFLCSGGGFAGIRTIASLCPFDFICRCIDLVSLDSRNMHIINSIESLLQGVESGAPKE